jgi:hypothetical protein
MRQLSQFSYRTFVWVFAVSNAIVWGGILCGLGFFLASHFAEGGRLTRHLAVRVLCLAWLLPTVLSLQGAIVNLRAQFLLGRFRPPSAVAVAATEVANPWSVAIRSGVLFWIIGLPLCWVGLHLLLPESVNAQAMVALMSAIGAVLMLGFILYVADREFQRYLAVIDQPRPARLSPMEYVVRYIAVPWGAVNLLINAVLAWITYGTGADGGHVALVDLRLDLLVMTFLISFFMALSALPEVETDVHRNMVQVPPWLPSMPRLWSRYGYAVALTLVMGTIFTAGMSAFGGASISLAAAIVIKAITSGIVAAGAAGTCALWALGRCAQRGAASLRVDAVAPPHGASVKTKEV